MRIWHCHRAATAALLLVCCILPAAAAADPASTAEPGPVGSAAAAASVSEELDPLFDDAFEAELDRTSNMQSSDPFEGTNRRIFAFNQGLDNFVFEPLTTGYRFVVPEPARKGIRRIFLNLDAPRVFVNDLLQLRFVDAGQTLTRFVLNSTLGVGGLLEAGEAAGLPRHDSDFGQTLARYGVNSGPFLMLPVFGPSTVRDGFGSIVDLAFQPLTYILGPGQFLVNFYISGGSSLTALDANRDKIDALEMSSVDFYAALRSAYLQNRRAAVAAVQPEPEPAESELARDDEAAKTELAAPAGEEPFDAQTGEAQARAQFAY
jgi:phospholipid-binding lipoprotein MlaA